VAKIGEAAHEAQSGGDEATAIKGKMRPGMNWRKMMLAQTPHLGRKGGNMGGWAWELFLARLTFGLFCEPLGVLGAQAALNAHP
jgi:hypothetical protein